jgi:hypothetical protein
VCSRTFGLRRSFFDFTGVRRCAASSSSLSEEICFLADLRCASPSCVCLNDWTSTIDKQQQQQQPALLNK